MVSAKAFALVAYLVVVIIAVAVNTDGVRFYSFNLEDHVPANHLLPGIDHFLDLTELHQQ